MKILFFILIIFVFLQNKVLTEPFENPDEKIFKSCGNVYEIDFNNYQEPLNGLYTEVLKMKYKNLGGLRNDIPMCFEEIHNGNHNNDDNDYDYFNPKLEDPMDPYSKPDETHKPILYGFDVDFIK